VQKTSNVKFVNQSVKQGNPKTQNTTGIQKTSSINQKTGCEKLPSSDSDQLLFSQKASTIKPTKSENKAIEDLQQTLQLILTKLNKQETIINEVVKRMTKIENKNSRNRSKKTNKK